MARPTAEQIFRGLLKGPFTTKAQSAANQWAGRTTLASGVATVVVSTTIVDSDSLVFLGVHAGATNPNSGFPVEVKSITPGAAIVFGTVQGQTAIRDHVIMWNVVRTQ